MRETFVLGVASTTFGKHMDRSFKDLTAEVYEAVLADAGLEDGGAVDQAWFGNCAMDHFGQSAIRGQVCMAPLVASGRFPERVPVVNVEGGCATGSMAFHGAWKDILSGLCDVSLAMGVEKVLHPEPRTILDIFAGGIDQLDTQPWKDEFTAGGDDCGMPFAPHPMRVVFMDVYAMKAAWLMKHRGVTLAQIAGVAAKNHNIGARNARAQYQFELTPEQVLTDKKVVGSLTRSMCCPVSDGASAALLCSADFLLTLPAHVRERAVRVRANALTGGKFRRLGEASLTQVAAQKAYALAGLSPADVDVAEVHDATAACELRKLPELGFCEPGEQGAFSAAGHTVRGGTIPVNTSGGLVSKGHPLGATGLGMIHEVVEQLRGEAGDRQVEGARIGLAENAGGTMGWEEAACSVTLLEATQ
jgi:acetyl-CoA acetyltransferase